MLVAVLVTLTILVLSITQSHGIGEISLNGEWKISNANGSIAVNDSVPGSVYTALMNNRILGDPNYRFNDVKYRWVSYDNWTYSRPFEVSAEFMQHSSIILICEGLDTVATVIINNNVVGKTNNMYRQYLFDIKGSLKEGSNMITVAFMSAAIYAANQAKSYPYVVPPECANIIQNGECHFNFIRKSATSFSWDWGPAFLTQGIWQNISILAYSSANIDYVIPSTVPVNGHTVWELQLRIKITTAAFLQNAVLNISLPQLGVTNVQSLKNLQKKHNTLFSNVTVKEPALWWPNGYGEQALYDVFVTFTSRGETCMKKIKIGFRTVELMQEPLPGKQGLSFYFQINGFPIFMKGTNWIPADNFQERVSRQYLWRLLSSTAEANMNMILVNGVGLYEQEAFYEIADELGIMVWQDFMFVCAMYPTNAEFLSNVAEEILHQVQRLSPHPSIAIWSGNNENEAALRQNWYGTSSKWDLYYKDYVKLYVDTVRKVVTTTDPSRPFVPSCPSNGLETEKEGWVAKDPQSPYFGDVHHYDYTSDSWNHSIFPVTRFTSEYGLQAWCSFENVAKVSIPEDWGMQTAFAEHRQHHPFGNKELINEVTLHLKPPTSSDPATNFRHWIYLTQINQAVGIKTESELLRRSQSDLNQGIGMTMGALYWQLNDIWQAPTWASIEYGGKWKMLHYFAKRFFNATLLSSYKEGDNVKVSLVYNGPPRPSFQPVDKHSRIYDQPLLSVLNIDCYRWSSLTPVKSNKYTFAVQDKASYTIFEMKTSQLLKEMGCTVPEECILFFYLNNDPEVIHDHLMFTYFKSARGLQKAQIKIKSVKKTSKNTFSISLQTSAVAPFVWLDAADISGRFSDNGFVMTRVFQQVKFYSWEEVSLSEVTAKLSVMSLMDVYQ